MNSINRSDFDKICRICLKIKTNMHLLYNSESISKIDESLNIKILIDHDLPNSICKKCTRDIDAAFQLKQLAIHSQKILADIIKNEELDDKQTIKTVQIKEENTFCNDVNLDAIIKDIVKEELPILTEPKDESEDGVSDVDNIEIDDSKLSDDEIDDSKLSNDEIDDLSNVERDEFNNLKCSDCGKSFPYPSKYKRHRESHIRKSKLPNYEYIDPRTIEKDEFNNFRCTDCGKSFRFISRYKQHRRTHTPRKTQACQSCGKIFNREVNLLRHQPVCDGIKPESRKRGLCNQCGKPVRNLELHTRVKHGNYRPHKCTKCTKTFKLRYSLTLHIRHVHEGVKYERTHLCNECGLTFRAITFLREHMLRRHLGRKPFKCKLCTAEYSTREGYSTHMARHTNTRVRKHECTVCGKKFFTAPILKQHMRIHTGERPYSCKICQKTFSQSGPLYVHMKSHKIFREQLT